jgi:hypothetical protein
VIAVVNADKEGGAGDLDYRSPKVLSRKEQRERAYYIIAGFFVLVLIVVYAWAIWSSLTKGRIPPN